ncbi:MAG: hypothetical protein AABX13_02775 [Nanoarchaeota archaeon]
MNSKILLVAEFILMAAYLALVFLVLDLKKGIGLALLGVISAALFFLVWLLEKKREKLKETEETGQLPGMPSSIPSTMPAAMPPTMPPSLPSAPPESPPLKPQP